MDAADIIATLEALTELRRAGDEMLADMLAEVQIMREIIDDSLAEVIDDTLDMLTGSAGMTDTRAVNRWTPLTAEEVALGEPDCPPDCPDEDEGAPLAWVFALATEDVNELMDSNGFDFSDIRTRMFAQVILDLREQIIELRRDRGATD